MVERMLFTCQSVSWDSQVTPHLHESFLLEETASFRTLPRRREARFPRHTPAAALRLAWSHPDELCSNFCSCRMGSRQSGSHFKPPMNFRVICAQQVFEHTLSLHVLLSFGRCVCQGPSSVWLTLHDQSVVATITSTDGNGNSRHTLRCL